MVALEAQVKDIVRLRFDDTDKVKMPETVGIKTALIQSTYANRSPRCILVHEPEQILVPPGVANSPYVFLKGRCP